MATIYRDEVAAVWDEPVVRVKGNDEFKVAADKLIEIIVAQLKTLKTKKSDW